MGRNRASAGPFVGLSAGPQEGDQAALPLAVERFLSRNDSRGLRPRGPALRHARAIRDEWRLVRGLAASIG